MHLKKFHPILKIYLDPVSYTHLTSYPIGDIFRRSYANSANGRKQVQEEIAEPYFSAVMAVWGEEPTVFPEEPEIIETEA